MKISSIVLVTLLTFSLANRVLIPSGVFSGTTGLLYTLQGVTERQRTYIETIEGCSIECTQSCLSQFHQDKLANCINLCGCQCLLSAEYSPMVHAVNAYSVDVTYPNGRREAVKLNNEPGSAELNFTDNADGSHGVVFDDRNTNGTDFDLYFDHSQVGNNEQIYADWQTLNPRDDGYLYSDTNWRENGFSQNAGLGLPNQNYNVQVQKQGQWQRTPNGGAFNLDETIVDPNGYVTIGTSGQIGATSNSTGNVSFEFEATTGQFVNQDLAAYNVTVTYPDGTTQVIPVSKRPGTGNLTFSETPNSEQVVYDDDRTVGVDFDFSHRFNSTATTSDDLFDWKTLNNTADGSAYNHVQQVPGGFDQQDGFRLPAQNYHVDVDKQVRFTGTNTTQTATITEVIRDPTTQVDVVAEVEHESTPQDETISFEFDANYGPLPTNTTVAAATTLIDTVNLEELVKGEEESGWVWFMLKGIFFLGAMGLLIFLAARWADRRKNQEDFYERLVVYHQL